MSSAYGEKRGQILPFLQLLVKEEASGNPLIALCDQPAHGLSRCLLSGLQLYCATSLLLSSHLPHWHGTGENKTGQ